MSKTFNIPEEYLAYDFGFSGVDLPQAEIREIPPVDPMVENKLDSLHEKLDKLTNSIGGSGDVTKYKENIRELEAIIVPLLNNLIKTKEKDYIYWPNRGPLIEKQLEKVLQITRG